MAFSLYVVDCLSDEYYNFWFNFKYLFVSALCAGKIVSFEPVVHYNDNYLVLIGIVAFITQLQLLHLLRYHKTISILGATLRRAMWTLISFGFIMAIIFMAFTSTIYLIYHDLAEYSTLATAMGSQVMTVCNVCTVCIDLVILWPSFTLTWLYD